MTTKWTIQQLDRMHDDVRHAIETGQTIVSEAQAEAERIRLAALAMAELDLPTTALLFALRAATPNGGLLLNDILALGRAMGVKEALEWRTGALELLTATGRARKAGARYVAPGWGTA
jgi:hypothetical protein